MTSISKETKERRLHLIAQGLKDCTMCEQVKPLSEFYKHPTALGGVNPRCKTCLSPIKREQHQKYEEQIIARGAACQEAHRKAARDATRRHRQKPGARERDRECSRAYNDSEHGSKVRQEYNQSQARKDALRRWTENNREKKQAIWHVWYARKKGILVKPDSCEKCGKQSDTIHAHHYLGYAPEHRLDVQWLCVECHEKAHHPDLGVIQ